MGSRLRSPAGSPTGTSASGSAGPSTWSGSAGRTRCCSGSTARREQEATITAAEAGIAPPVAAFLPRTRMPGHQVRPGPARRPPKRSAARSSAPSRERCEPSTQARPSARPSTPSTWSGSTGPRRSPRAAPFRTTGRPPGLPRSGSTSRYRARSTLPCPAMTICCPPTSCGTATASGWWTGSTPAWATATSTSPTSP